jgi:D-arabinose 1-dehydrogenase-like Zn-dependent alcohol dehydrogenase
MATARAAVFLGPQKPMELRDFPVPVPRSDEALIRITQTNICGSDLHMWRGDLSHLANLPPVILGHEMTGRIEKLGSSITADSLGTPLAEGDRVVYAYFTPCGRCRPCVRGHQNACLAALASAVRPCEVPPHFFGGFAELYVLSARQTVFKVPESLSDAEVAGANCALSQVMFGLERAAFSCGEDIVIQGAGGLGLYAVAVAREMGARTIVVIDGIRERLDLARAMGADETIDVTVVSEPRARTQRVLDLTGGWGADVVVEVVGFPQVVPEGIRMLARGGRYLEMGNIAARLTYPEDPSILVGPNRSIIGVSLYVPFTLKKALDFLVRCRDRYPLRQVAAQTFSLERINDAFATADAFAQEKKGVTRIGVRPA